MASWGGHTLPGTFFIIFGIFYVFKFTRSYLRRRKSGLTNVSYCCKGRIPISGIVVEGIVKIVMVSIGILIELFYPGAPMGRLHADSGQFTHPMNWQHATMYFFFGLAGVAEILSHTARNVLPAGFDRIFGALALFVEGYLFFFHLHGRSNIDTRVHILLVLAVWPGALFTFLHCFVMRKRKILHIFEMLTATFLIVQGTWFWQAAYILYPPDGNNWDPCMTMVHMKHDAHSHSDDNNGSNCNTLMEAQINNMFITLFWTWHVLAACIFVGFFYFFMYRYLRWRGMLDPMFLGNYQEISSSNGSRFHSGTLLHEAIVSDEDEDNDL